MKNENHKRNKGWLLLTTLMLFAGIFLMGKDLSAQAADSRYYVNIGNITQTEYATDSATFAWSLSYVSSMNTTTTAKYNIYLGEDYQNLRLATSTTTTSCRLTGLTDGKKYYIRVEPVAADGTVSSYRGSTIETMPARVKNFAQKQWWFFIHVLDVSWDPIETADKITVSLYNSRGKRVGKTQTLPGYAKSASFSKMKDEVYTVKIQASRTVNGKTFTTPVSTIQCFNQARVKSAKVSRKKLTVSWGKVGGATGYDIYVSTKARSGYKKVKSVRANVSKVTIPKFKGKSFNSRKTYYVYVETKKKNGKKMNKSGKLYYWNSKNSGYGYF